MSTEVAQAKTVDPPAEHDDGQIRLVDSTIVGAEDANRLTSNESWRRLARIPTKHSVKEELSRRKYRSWRQDRFDAEDGTADDGSTRTERAGLSAPLVESHPENEESQTVDFGGRPEAADDGAQQSKATVCATKDIDDKPEHEIDILYENQRGSFFCGIPLYSHSSLLNFDPAAWVNRDFRNSPVNITNAQVPDPSWMWMWKTWYVDMSGDVDEEGWQYSFMFGNKFAWHGTHPWFHSFVRRRRWLRKRVKRTDGIYRKDKEGTMEAAHHLNTDYFTIHSRPRDRSPAEASNPDAQLARPASYQSIQSIDEDLELKAPEDINNIPSLMKALRRATIDREKVDAVRHFIDHGGDELFYLEDNMSEIMSQLIFQNTRRQILQYLKDQAGGARQHRDEHDAEDRPEGANEKRRIDNLLKAAEAANKEISGLEYWSDRKHVLQTADEIDEGQDPKDLQSKHVLGEIKGISTKAETADHIRVDRRLTQRLDKGKAPERQKSPTDDGKREMPAYGRDTMLVPDEDEDKGDSNEAAWEGQSATPVELDM